MILTFLKLYRFKILPQIARATVFLKKFYEISRGAIYESTGRFKIKSKDTPERFKMVINMISRDAIVRRLKSVDCLNK
jgi:hypothetical protein